MATHLILSDARKQKLQVTDRIDQGHKAQESDQGNSSDEPWWLHGHLSSSSKVLHCGL